MLKKYIYVGLFAVVCLGLVGVILLKKLDKITPIEVLEAVPDDALVFIEEIDFEYIAEKFIPENRIWIDFVNTTGRNKLDSMARNFLSQISTSEALSDLLRKEGMSLSLHLKGKEELTPLIYLPYTGYYSDHDFEQIVLALLGDESIVN